MTNLTSLKFKADGRFNHFIGNTVVANLAHQPSVVDVVKTIQETYGQLPFFHKLTLVPLSSLHMTVMELLCDQNRHPDFWSKYLPLEMPISEIHEYFGQQLTSFPLDQEVIRMKVTGLGYQNILLEPADEVSRSRLVAIRQYISYQTGVLFPNHNSYQFHITTAYLREQLTEEEASYFSQTLKELEPSLLSQLPEVIISRIDYTTFESMAAFVPYHKN